MQDWKNQNLINKTGYSMSGLFSAFKNEKAIRNEFLALVLLVALSAYFTAKWKIVLLVFFVSLLPMVIELINTAFETIIDMAFGPTYREDVRLAKDMLSASVLLTLIASYGTSLLLIFFN